VVEAGLPQPGDGVLERPDAGEDELPGVGDAVRVGGNLRGVADRLERLLDAPQVGHPVIDDDDLHGSPRSPATADPGLFTPARAATSRRVPSRAAPTPATSRSRSESPPGASPSPPARTPFRSATATGTARTRQAPPRFPGR